MEPPAQALSGKVEGASSMLSLPYEGRAILRKALTARDSRYYWETKRNLGERASPVHDDAVALPPQETHCGSVATGDKAFGRETGGEIRESHFSPE